MLDIPSFLSQYQSLKAVALRIDTVIKRRVCLTCVFNNITKVNILTFTFVNKFVWICFTKVYVVISRIVAKDFTNKYSGLYNL